MPLGGTGAAGAQRPGTRPSTALPSFPRNDILASSRRGHRPAKTSLTIGGEFLPLRSLRWGVGCPGTTRGSVRSVSDAYADRGTSLRAREAASGCADRGYALTEDWSAARGLQPSAQRDDELERRAAAAGDYGVVAALQQERRRAASRGRAGSGSRSCRARCRDRAARPDRPRPAGGNAAATADRARARRSRDRRAHPARDFMGSRLAADRERQVRDRDRGHADVELGGVGRGAELDRRQPARRDEPPGSARTAACRRPSRSST